MATRIKTIEYAFALATADVNAGTARDFTSFTMYIPEASPVFKSVILEMGGHDNSTAASITAVLMGISLGAVARSDATVTQTITNSGENQSFIFTRDVTSYFSTNWTGTSMTVGSRLTISGAGTRNCTSKLIITYQYDDTAATQIKTVRIPMEGNTGNLTTVLTNLGGVANQIPALDDWLPENGVTIRDIFFETYTHTGQTGGTNDRALNMSFNSGTNTISMTTEGGLTSDYPIKRIDKLMSGGSPLYATNQAWSVQASTANTDTPFPCLSGIYTVTYEFDLATTVNVMNSLLLPIIDEDGYITPSSDFERYRKTVYIQEPLGVVEPGGYSGDLSLKQSAVLFSCIDSGAVTIDLRIGAQTSRQYAHAATQRCGAMYMMRRFDAGAVQDSTIVLARGENFIDVDYFTTSTTAGSQGSNASGVLILNYDSGVSPQGIGAHNKTTLWCIRPYTAVTLSTQLIFTNTRTPEIPETNYWITCNGFELKLLTTGATAGTLATAIQAEILPAEGNGAGWINYYSSMYNSDAEIGPSIMWNTCKGSFVQNPTENIATQWKRGQILYETSSRTYRYDQLTAIGHLQATKFLTYHSITSSFAGTVTGFTNYTRVEVYPEINDGTENENISYPALLIDSVGNFSGIWYDDTKFCRLHAIEFQGAGDVFKTGMAKNQGIATGDFNIEITEVGATAGGPTYYSYG
jgi:hypothetical protein